MNKELPSASLEKAFKIIRQAVSEILKAEANQYLEKRKFALAKRRIDQACEQGLPALDYHEFMADYYDVQGKSIECIYSFKKCISFLKKQKKFQKTAECYLNISRVYLNLGNKKQEKYHAVQAYQYYKKDIDAPDDWILYHNIGVQLRNVGCKDLGINVYKDGFDKTDDSIFRVRLFEGLVIDKRYEEAIDLVADVPLSQLPDYKAGLDIICKKTKNDGLLRQHLSRLQQFYKEEIDDSLKDYADVKRTDPEISINGLTVDLKQLDDGSIRILEVNFLPASGLNGYNPYHKHRLQDVIDAGYRGLSGWLEEAGYYDRKVDNYIQNRFVGMGSPISFSNFIVMAYAQRPVLFNASLNTLMAQHYKDEFVLSVQGHGLGAYIPETVVASRYETAQSILERTQNIQSDEMIIKTSNDARGEGVEVISSHQLPNVVDNIINGGAWHSCVNPKSWEEDVHPNFLIQECVQSKPCRASNGQSYDGTMRVALTHIFEHVTGENHLMIHGMFWKLPKRPLSKGRARDRIVSLANNKDIVRGNPHSARVAPSRQAQVRGHLTDFFETYGGHMASPNHQVIQSKKHIAQVTTSRPIGFLATEQLTSHPYGNLMAVLSKNNPDAPRTIFDFVSKIQNSHMEQIKKAWLMHRHGDMTRATMKEARRIYSRSRNVIS